MQPLDEIEKSYASNPDPWGYKSNPADHLRRDIIVDRLRYVRPGIFHRVLDIGGGEGFITEAVPAIYREVYDCSPSAKSRLPHHIKGVDKPEGAYPLVMATGILYLHYDHKLFLDLIRKHASEVVLTCNISNWECPEIQNEKYVTNTLGLEQVFQEKFNYIPDPKTPYVQQLRIFLKRT